MIKLSMCALGAALLTVGLPSVAAAEISATMAHPVGQLRQLVLEDCSHAFIGSDHKLYLIVNGKTTPAPAGHYSLADGGCVTVGANAAVDPASFQHIMATSSHM